MKKYLLKGVALFSLALSANAIAQCDDTNFNAWTDAREDVAGQMEATTPGLDGTTCKMEVKAASDKDEKARVQDKSPSCESSYRARFIINVDDVGVLATNHRNKVFNAQCSTAQNGGAVNCMNFGIIQFKIQGDGAGGNIFRVFTTDENMPNPDNRRKLDVPISSGDQPFEMQWIRATGPATNDGIFRIWSNGNTVESSPDFEFTDVNNYNACIDQVNLGLVGPNQNYVDNTQNEVLLIDEFESRRQTGIGVN